MSHYSARIATFRYVAVVFTCLLFAVTDLSAQQAKVSLPQRTASLSELFSEIERQTGSMIMFDADDPVLNERVAMPLRQGSASELLDAVLPNAGYTWQITDRYILVRPAEKPEPTQAVAPQPTQPQPTQPQPTQEEFERDVRDYTLHNIASGQQGGQVIVRYDTIRTEKPHSGIFEYPSREVTSYSTGQKVSTPFDRNTPPLLAVKTNLVWWAANGTLNIGGEIGLGKRTSLEISGGLNRWGVNGNAESNKKLAHWVVKPEFRYWLCERFNGHFFGLHALYGQYNVGGYDVPLFFEKEYRYDGYAYGAGVNYGYHLPIAKRWGVEFTAGVGVIRMDYTKYECPKCGSEIEKFGKTYFRPTELGVKLIFMIK